MNLTAVAALALASGCATTSNDAYGGELAALDAVHVATIDTHAALSDRHPETREHVRAVVPVVVFSWIALESADHIAHDNAAGAVLGPAVKFGIPYLIFAHTRWMDRNPIATSLLVLACMIVDDAAIARAQHAPAPPMMVGVSQRF